MSARNTEAAYPLLQLDENAGIAAGDRITCACGVKVGKQSRKSWVAH
jgi:hypothetical protein